MTYLFMIIQGTNTAFLAGMFGIVGQVYYSKANAGVIVFTKSVAKELSFRKIYVRLTL